jgi:hypothetical protein
MNRAWKAFIQKAVIAPLLLIAAAGPAWSYTLNFTGTVDSTAGVFPAAGIAPGDAVSGSLTYDVLNSTPSVTMPWPDSIGVFKQASASFTFRVTHPGTLDFVQTRTGTGQVESNGFPTGARLGLYAGDGVNDLQLSYRTDGATPALTSLASLPTDSSAILALLTGHVLNAVGFYRIDGFGDVSFRLAFTPVATTPIPAALPLFVSALGGFGFLAWRRRAAAA